MVRVGGLVNLLLWLVFTVLCFREFTLANSTAHDICTQSAHHHRYDYELYQNVF